MFKFYLFYLMVYTIFQPPFLFGVSVQAQVSYGQSSITTAVILLAWAFADALGVIVLQYFQSSLAILQLARIIMVTWHPVGAGLGFRVVSADFSFLFFKNHVRI